MKKELKKIYQHAGKSEGKIVILPLRRKRLSEKTTGGLRIQYAGREARRNARSARISPPPRPPLHREQFV